MITHGQEGEVTINNIQGVQSMGMKVNGKSFALLIDKLYTRKEDAVVRELGSNARDAMTDLARLLGIPPGQFIIGLPNTICHELVVSDNGTGLSIENVHKYLGNLFESSKENENNSIGAYGLGSKSPFAVTDSYVIESRFEGEIHSFSFFRAKGGIPQLVHIGTKPTTEPNGITFRVPSSPSRYDTYARAAAAQLFFFDPRPIVHGNVEGLDIWENYGKVVMEQNRWKIVDSYGLRNYYGELIANMGGVSYPLDVNRISEIDIEDDFLKSLDIDVKLIENRIQEAQTKLLYVRRAMSHNRGHVITFFFDIGDLEIPPSREALEYDAQTCYKILLAIEDFVVELAEKFRNEIEVAVDASSIKTFDDTIKPFLNILDWTSGCVVKDALRDLNWEIDVANKLPQIINSKGQPVSGKIMISAADPKDVLSKASIIFPHHEVIQRKTNSSRHNCDKSGVITDQTILDNYENVIQSYQKAGFNEVKRSIREFETSRGLAYELNIEYEKFEKVFSPSLMASPCILPPYGAVNVKRVNVDNSIASVYCNNEFFGREHSRYGGRNLIKELLIYLDDENRDRTRYGTWAARKWIAELQGETDEQKILQINLNNYTSRHQVRYIKSHDEAGYKFLDAYLATLPEAHRPTVYRISELVIPKPVRTSVNNLSIRGLRRLRVTSMGDKRSEGWSNLNLSSSFDAIPNTEEEVKPGWVVFSDGSSETPYLDPECTQTFDFKTTLAALAWYARMIGEKAITLYRMTPMLTKNLAKFRELGFKPLLEVFGEIGGASCGRNQFQRRYKAFRLARAYITSDDIYKISTRRFDHKHGSRILDFQKAHELEAPRFAKYVNMSLYSLNGRGAFSESLDYSANSIFCFGHRYIAQYGKLKHNEAMRLVIDYLVDTNKFSHLVPFEDRYYMAEMEGRAIVNFQKSRASYIKRHFRQVLFGNNFDRSSIEFQTALDMAKKLLMK